ncbi:MAG: sulfatase [Planctomycetota bacterium]
MNTETKFSYYLRIFAVMACCWVLGSTNLLAKVQEKDIEFVKVEAGHLKRPNIIWVMGEDMSIEWGCYGHPAVKTPHLDDLAKRGILFRNAFTTAPSCTPSRNAMMTGVFQTRTDTQDQRRRGIELPENIKPITTRLQESGYYTAIGCGFSNKLDLNFDETDLFDGKDWKERDAQQPFFAQITLYDSHRLEDGWQAIKENAKNPVDRAAVELPPFFPDHAVVREDWARYLEAIQRVDEKLGQIIARLEREKIADNTVVIFIGDNGRCHLRGKCWLYEGGIRVPLVMYVPEGKQIGIATKQLVSAVDISATILDLAGIEPGDHLDGLSLLRAEKPREYIFSARDLIDEVRDPMRCIRTQKFKYIRNYKPELGYAECRYVQNHRPMLKVIQELGRLGKLDAAQQLILGEKKPDEELYDLEQDPHELKNLADDSDYREIKSQLIKQLDQWIESTGDTGLKMIENEDE